MAILLETLKDIYQNDQFNHNSWIAIPDSKEGTITPEVIGDSGGETGNAWKIHISIDPSKMAEAAEIICRELNALNAPKISIKFAGNVLAGDGQPGKQVAFTPYAEAMNDIASLEAFLNKVEQALTAANIGQDPRPINSDPEQASRKWDAQISDQDGNPTRFNYRYSNITVLEDKLMDQMASRVENIREEGALILVRQSYFMQLPPEQKHNPVELTDPFANMRLHVLQSTPAPSSQPSTLTPIDQSEDTASQESTSQSQAASTQPQESSASQHQKQTRQQATTQSVNTPPSERNHPTVQDPQPAKTKMSLGLKILLGIAIALTFPISLPIFFIVRAVQKYQKQQAVSEITATPITASGTQPKSSQFKPAGKVTTTLASPMASAVEPNHEVRLGR